MKSRDLREMIGHNGTFRPFVISTQSGARYEITDPAQVWLPGPYSDVICVALAGKGITVLDIEAIEAVQLEVV